MDDDKTKDPTEMDEQDGLKQDAAQDDLQDDEHSDYKPVDRFDASAVHHL